MLQIKIIYNHFISTPYFSFLNSPSSPRNLSPLCPKPISFSSLTPSQSLSFALYILYSLRIILCKVSDDRVFSDIRKSWDVEWTLGFWWGHSSELVNFLRLGTTILLNWWGLNDGWLTIEDWLLVLELKVFLGRNFVLRKRHQDHKCGRAGHYYRLGKIY